MTKTYKYREFDRLSRLIRRADFLRAQIERRKRYGNFDLNRRNHDVGELSALDWAIEILEAYLIKKYTAQLDAQTLAAIKHQIPEHLYEQLTAQEVSA